MSHFNRLQIGVIRAFFFFQEFSLYISCTFQAPPSNIEKDLNIDVLQYDADYAVTFNLQVWTAVILILSLLFISYGIWNMDPGRDSIIYRMTTQRMKKD